MDKPTSLAERELSVKLGYGIGFKRFRRITGYLSSDFRRWNNGKLAECNDRVKHNS